ncbi:MAG: GYD domain-containing protein [Verrucomicrobiota bacterium]|mgnify:CR=1 FL=1
MTRYLVLLQFTERGLKNLNMSTARAHAFAKAAQKAGVTIEGQYWTVGRCDGALILSAENRGRIHALLATLAAAGNVRPEALETFTDEEFDANLGN